MDERKPPPDFVKRHGGFAIGPKRNGISTHSLVQHSHGNEESYQAKVIRCIARIHSWRPINGLSLQAGKDVCIKTLRDGCWNGGNCLPISSRRELRRILGEYEWFALRDSVMQPFGNELFPKPFSWPTARLAFNYATTALWSFELNKSFSADWLASVALNALEVEQDHFRFGYYVSELMQKLENEDNAVRGEKAVRSAASGGRLNSQRFEGTRRKVIGEMKRLIEKDGMSIANAARIVCKRGTGATPGANRAIWYRHR